MINEELRVHIPFKNFGQTPALNVKVRARASFDRITEEILRSKEYTPGVSMIVPDGARGITIDLSPDARPRLVNGEYLWLGIIIEYQYGKDEQGEYGLIGEYSFTKGHDRTDIEWSK
jgi:hypothetical protein